jgi:hypothetical protein
VKIDSAVPPEVLATMRQLINAQQVKPLQF